MILETYSSFSDAANSPFIVPVASCAMVLGIVVASVWAGTRRNEMKSQERLAAIAKGVPLPPSAEELAIMHGKPTADTRRRRANIRLAGIVLIAAAAGIVLFFLALAAVLQERDVLCGAACGLIPLGIGVGFLIDTRIQSREIEDANLSADAAASAAYPPRPLS